MREYPVTKFSIVITTILIVGFAYLCIESVIKYCAAHNTKSLILIIAFGAVCLIQILDLIQRIKKFKKQ